LQRERAAFYEIRGSGDQWIAPLPRVGRWRALTAQSAATVV
jgi:hypothetical protein